MQDQTEQPTFFSLPPETLASWRNQEVSRLFLELLGTHRQSVLERLPALVSAGQEAKAAACAGHIECLDAVMQYAMFGGNRAEETEPFVDPGAI